MKRADALKPGGRRRRGRPILKCEDCVKKYFARVGGEGRGEGNESEG